ncbi:hypothetical protein HDV00_000577 [Rhizophlyctis rosea]|nr:hypothetical protein HDV00_000577 [Rhizophlyctis rosea]
MKKASREQLVRKESREQVAPDFTSPHQFPRRTLPRSASRGAMKDDISPEAVQALRSATLGRSAAPTDIVEHPTVRRAASSESVKTKVSESTNGIGTEALLAWQALEKQSLPSSTPSPAPQPSPTPEPVQQMGAPMLVSLPARSSSLKRQKSKPLPGEIPAPPTLPAPPIPFHNDMLLPRSMPLMTQTLDRTKRPAVHLRGRSEGHKGSAEEPEGRGSIDRGRNARNYMPGAPEFHGDRDRSTSRPRPLHLAEIHIPDVGEALKGQEGDDSEKDGSSGRNLDRGRRTGEGSGSRSRSRGRSDTIRRKAEEPVHVKGEASQNLVTKETQRESVESDLLDIVQLKDINIPPPLPSYGLQTKDTVKSPAVDSAYASSIISSFDGVGRPGAGPLSPLSDGGESRSRAWIPTPLKREGSIKREGTLQRNGSLKREDSGRNQALPTRSKSLNQPHRAGTLDRSPGPMPTMSQAKSSVSHYATLPRNDNNRTTSTSILSRNNTSTPNLNQKRSVTFHPTPSPQPKTLTTRALFPTKSVLFAIHPTTTPIPVLQQKLQEYIMPRIGRVLISYTDRDGDVVVVEDQEDWVVCLDEMRMKKEARGEVWGVGGGVDVDLVCKVEDGGVRSVWAGSVM